MINKKQLFIKTANGKITFLLINNRETIVSKTFNLNEIDEFYRLFYKYLTNTRIKEIDIQNNTLKVILSNENVLNIEDLENILEALFINIKLKYYEDRELFFMKNKGVIKKICLHSDYDYQSEWYDYLSNKKIFFTSIFVNNSHINRDKDFLEYLLDYYIDNKSITTLTEYFKFNKEKEAISLRKYTLKQNNIKFEYNEDLYLFMNNWLENYEDLTYNNVIKVLNGGKYENIKNESDIYLKKRLYRVIEGEDN